jgi:threonine dehydrogenase-like Zn-dependent dehydrogenase
VLAAVRKAKYRQRSLSWSVLAARITKPGVGFEINDVDVPAIGPDDALVEIKAAGVCGTDLHYSRGEFLPPLPRTFGHEGAGVVKEVGSNVTDVKVGDRVTMHYVISCGVCKHCMRGNDNRCRRRVSIGHDVDGVFAEYVKIPARNAVPMAPNIPFDWGAVTGCAVSTAYHAVTISGLRHGDTAVVFGAGGVGLHAAMWARFFGAGKVISVDLVDSKLAAARRYGADVTLNPSREDVLEVVKRETDGWGADAVIECSGSHAAMEQAIKSAKGKNPYETGTIVSVGLQTKPFEANFMGLREGRLMVSGDHNRGEVVEILRLEETGRVDLSTSITKHISLGEINDAVNMLATRQENVERTIIDKMVR